MQEGWKGLFVNILILSTLCLFLSFLMAFFYILLSHFKSLAWNRDGNQGAGGGLCD